MAFKKNKEDFVCEKCLLSVTGTGYTNHCPKCLWSKHVDNQPGDRLNPCLGMMKPVRIEKEKQNFMIVHRCENCSVEKRNRVGESDDFDAVVALAKQYALNEAKK